MPTNTFAARAKRAVASLVTIVLVATLLPTVAYAAGDFSTTTLYIKNATSGKGSGYPTTTTASGENGDTIRGYALVKNTGTASGPTATLTLPAELTYDDNSLYTSTDGIAWTQYNTSNDTDLTSGGIAFGAVATSGVQYLRWSMTVGSAAIATYQPGLTITSDGGTTTKYATVKVPMARVTSSSSATNQLVVTFGEPMKVDAALTTLGNYTVAAGACGVASFAASNPTAVTYDTNDHTATLTFAGGTLSGSQALKIKGTLTNQNVQLENSATDGCYATANFSTTDTTAPTLTSATLNADRTLDIVFSEAMQTGDISDASVAARVTVNNAHTLGTTPTTAWTATDTLQITLDTNYTVAVGDTLTLAGVVRDLAGNNGAGAHVIIAGNAAPTVTSFTYAGGAYTNTSPMTLALTANDADGTVDYYTITTTSSQPTTVATGFTTTPSYAISTLGQGAHTLYPWVKDNGGTISTVYSTPLTITYDTVAPTGGSISINAAATYATSTTLALTLAATDATTSVAQMQFSCDSSTWTTAEAYVTSKSLNLATAGASCTTTDGVKTIYARFIDAAGNTSGNVSDTITLDTAAPAFSSVTPANSATVNNITSSVGYTLSEALASGAITITRTGGTADGGSPHTCTLVGTALSSGAHAAVDLTNTTNGCTSATTLVSGAIYTFAFNGADAAGNTATTVSRTGVTYDTTAPAFSAVTPVDGGAVKNVTTSSGIGYTISKALASGTITITRTGGTADGGSPHTCTLVGTALNSGAHTINLADTTNSCASTVTLIVGAVYTFAFAGTDAAGNSATVVTNTGIAYDTTAPTITITDNASSSNVTSDAIIATITDNFDLATLKWGYDADGTCSTTASDYVNTYTSGATISVTPTQTTYICFYAADEAGNVTTTATTRLHVVPSSSGGGGGGGGGGGSSIDTTTPYILPTTETETSASIYRPLSFELTGGRLTRPMSLYDYYTQTITLTFKKGGTVTSANGGIFTGTVSAPRSTNLNPVGNLTAASGATLASAPTGAKLPTNTVLTLPVGTGDPTTLHFYRWNATNKNYDLVSGTATVSADKKTMSIAISEVGYYGLFVSSTATLGSGSTTGTTGTTTTPGTTTSGGLTDIPAGEWFATFVNTLVTRGIAGGYPDGTFRPDSSLNRAELAKIAAKAFALVTPASVTERLFPDVDPTAWFAPFVAAVKNASVVGGYPDKTFKPERVVNRAEALKILLGAAGITVEKTVGTSGFDDVPADAWYAPYVAKAKELGIVSGTTETITTGSFTRKLIIGLTGDDVTELQTILTQLGYFTGPITGFFGPKTQAAVINFQNATPGTKAKDGLGAVGTATGAAIFAAAGKTPGVITRNYFKPDELVTRAAMAKMVIQTLTAVGK